MGNSDQQKNALQLWIAGTIGQVQAAKSDLAFYLGFGGTSGLGAVMHGYSWIFSILLAGVLTGALSALLPFLLQRRTSTQR